MTDILIDVRGRAHVTAAPEIGVVHAAITADGPEPGPVSARVSEALGRIRSSLEILQAEGAIERFAVDQIRLSAQRPWNQDGEQLPLVHTATITITPRFTDFSALGQWITSEGLTVHYIDWQLTDETQARLERETRQAALSDAVARAQDYADTLDLGPVLVRAVRDPGTEPQPHMLMARGAAPEAGGIDVSPEDVEISAEVHATFTVDA